ncbi:MAG: universal stress protein [Chloroflexi bacterium]|nr:universal stress protein [Chloroflexota bacterium]
MPPSRILVTVNGNATDDEAVAMACDAAKVAKAEVYAIYVIEVKRTLPLDVDLPPEAAKGDAILAHAENIARQSRVAIETELLQARDVGTAIVDEAAERQVDLIVLGAPYKRRFGEFDLGRTVPYVLKNAPCRVWLTRSAPTQYPPSSEPRDRENRPSGAH